MHRFEIVKGPSQFKFWLSLVDGEGGATRCSVSFTLFSAPPPHSYSTGHSRIRVVIDGLERLDASGENWNFRGHQVDLYNRPTSNSVSGSYSTRTRKGILTWWA